MLRDAILRATDEELRGRLTHVVTVCSSGIATPTLECILGPELGLPANVGVDVAGELALNGKLHLDFAVGVDLSSLQNGISADELFVTLNDLTITGEIDAEVTRSGTNKEDKPSSSSRSIGVLKPLVGLAFAAVFTL